MIVVENVVEDADDLVIGHQRRPRLELYARHDEMLGERIEIRQEVPDEGFVNNDGEGCSENVGITDEPAPRQTNAESIQVAWRHRFEIGLKRTSLVRGLAGDGERKSVVTTKRDIGRQGDIRHSRHGTKPVEDLMLLSDGLLRRRK